MYVASTVSCYIYYVPCHAPCLYTIYTVSYVICILLHGLLCYILYVMLYSECDVLKPWLCCTVHQHCCCRCQSALRNLVWRQFGQFGRPITTGWVGVGRRPSPSSNRISAIPHVLWLWVEELLLCYVMLCYVMLCYVMLCYVMLCYVTLLRSVLPAGGAGGRGWAGPSCGVMRVPGSGVDSGSVATIVALLAF